ncbi:MAG: hypothetical protein VZS44_01955 [Bacilli bacterium]|nr:hypothetical protein [Bacilli bacterium]
MKNDKLINKYYMISRFIIAILTFIILSIIYKDSSLNLGYLIFALIAFGISFPSSVISKKIINKGNKIENKTMRVLYAVALLIIIIVLLFLLYTIIPFVFESLLHASSFNDAIRQSLIGVFIIIVGTVCVVVPYVQTIIVLILAKFIKE